MIDIPGVIRRLATATLAFFCIAALVAGCGGGGAGSPAGGGAAGATAVVTANISLPTGYKAPAGGLFVSGSLMDKTAFSGTSATIKAWQQGRELVAVVDKDGNPLLMGFVDASHNVIDAKSTASAMLYFAIGGYASAEESQGALLENLDRFVDLPAIATDITAELVTSGNLSSTTAKYRATLTHYEAQILGSSSGSTIAIAHPHSVTIDPSKTAKSGVTVDYGATQQQIANSNTFRRRVLLFTDQVSTTDDNGVVTPAPKQVDEQELRPALGTVSPLDLIGLLYGSPVTVTGTPVTLPDVPTNLSQVTYKVTAAGSGVKPGEASTLTASEQSDLRSFLERAFVKDYFFPFFNRLLVNSTMSQTQGVSSYQLLENAVDANPTITQQFVQLTFPNAVDQLQQGDYRGATSSILSSLQDPNKQSQVANFYVAMLGAAQLPGMNANSDRLTFMLKWISHAVTTPDTGQVILPEFAAYDASNRIDSWQIAVNRVTVKLTPAQSTVDARGTQDIVTLTATAQFPTGIPEGGTLLYTWITTGKHGDLTVNSDAGVQSGTRIANTSFNAAVYGANKGLGATQGDDDVTVEVSLKDKNGVVSPVGSAKATVSVVAKSDVTLIPRALSVLPNGTSSSIVARTDFPENFTNGNATLVWSSTGKFGKLNAPSGQTTQTSVTFSAGATQGVDTVSCDYYWKGEKLSTATMEVRVEKNPTIEFGEAVYRSGPSSTNPGLNGYLEAERIPKVEGATSYTVHCYNFNDPAAYGNHKDYGFDGSGNGASQDIDANGQSLGTRGADGSFYMTGPGGFRNPADIGAELQALRNRFAGMIVEVTVHY